MTRRPPRSTRTATLFPDTTLVRSRTSLRVDPVTVTGGNTASFQLIVVNEGNSTVQERPVGEDPEDVVDIVFEPATRSEEHTSELQSLMRISYAVFCLKKKK